MLKLNKRARIGDLKKFDNDFAKVFEHVQESRTRSETHTVSIIPV